MRRLVWAALLGTGCHLVAGIEDAELIEPTGGACSTDAACNDGNPCTIERCDEGSCSYENRDGELPGDEQSQGDCQRRICEEGVLVVVEDEADVPFDGKACTHDRCLAGIPDHEPLPLGTPCDEAGGILCNGTGQCVACASNAHCTLPETCGGSGIPGECGCTPIPCSQLGLTCGFAADDGCGGTLNCNNGAQDGEETDVDCGGPVGTCATRCNAGKACEVPSDCASGICELNECA